MRNNKIVAVVNNEITTDLLKKSLQDTDYEIIFTQQDLSSVKFIIEQKKPFFFLIDLSEKKSKLISIANQVSKEYPHLSQLFLVMEITDNLYKQIIKIKNVHVISVPLSKYSLLLELGNISKNNKSKSEHVYSDHEVNLLCYDKLIGILTFKLLKKEAGKYDIKLLKANQIFYEIFNLENKSSKENINKIFNSFSRIIKNWKKILINVSTKKVSHHDVIYIKSIDKKISLSILPDNSDLLLFIQDVTSSKKVDKLIPGEEPKYFSCFKHSSDAIMLLDPQKGFIDCNQAALKMFGFTDITEFLGKKLSEISPEYQKNKVISVDAAKSKIEEAFNKGKLKFEWIHKRKNGENFYADILLTKIKIDSKNVFLATIRDIGSQKKSESKLYEYIDFLNTLIETIPHPIYFINNQSELRVSNSSFSNTILGIPRLKAIGKTLQQLSSDVSEDTIEMLTSTDEQIMGSLKFIDFEYEVKCADGDIKVFKVHKSPFLDKFNQVHGLITVMLDITELKKIEIDLKEEEENYKNLLSSIDSILIGISSRDKITHWNRVTEKTFGIKAEEVIGKRVTEIKIGWAWDKVYMGIAEAMVDLDHCYLSDVSYKARSGKTGALGMSINPIFDNNQIVKGFLIYGRDVTEKRKMESQLLQNQKLKSIGELAAGIAHEINTPMQYINDNVHFFYDSCSTISTLLEKYNVLINSLKEKKSVTTEINEIDVYKKEKDLGYIIEEVPVALKQTIQGINSVSNIVSSMKSFSHPGQEEMVSVDINKAIQNTAIISRNEWKYNCDLETELDENLPQVKCYPAEINQVFLNMIINAAHAIETAIKEKLINRGKIMIKTGFDNDFASIEISDNGEGIPEYVKSHIFDPFYTTKDIGKGTGQGLAISYSIIVEKHNGQITVESEVNKGATFIIQLPIDKNENGG